ncbi:hypothetical protein L198_05897 [Cryptococcus wingfieldii CBS 7118]|uniref:Uncharacterized protein n=1 Tax=Cryptococcus wingfieldii CBS 7118 TaxID=1295528 RepID=A0A1E3IRY0_9TREE|nr:hypothetical protein L198_05897 [Cryptococcus wingfieldii CBS 7118]ODN91383.1 hypothetical protein L198_05897 [Cryptococcus wingfieldii CBS 7118]
MLTESDQLMELYMSLASVKEESQHENFGKSSEGLGYLDSSQSVLELLIDIEPPKDSSAVPEVVYGKGRRRKGTKKEGGKDSMVSIPVVLNQDLTALRGRKGDTGSVLWRSSLHLARHVLFHHLFRPQNPLLDIDRLNSAHILELGCGTGLLAILLSQLCGQYTASDQLDNLKLIQRNLELNDIPVSFSSSTPVSESAVDKKGMGREVKKEVVLEEVDWVEVSKSQGRYRSPDDTKTYDLILAVDCIYNEHLIQPLIDTFAQYCQPGSRTVVWVVVELRSADVIGTFLNTWIDDPSGPWTIVRLGEDDMGDWGEGRKPRWVGWVGWR